VDYDVCKSFGKKIRGLRLAAGLSQEQLASLCELDRTYIGGIERGERNPALKNIYRLARALNLPISELFEGLEGANS
jgi:transcriptional regulator with XRE-family HTH domain